MDVYGRNIYRSWEWSANITGGPRATGRCVPLFRTIFLCLSSPVWFIAQLPWLTNWPPDHHLSLVPSCTPFITIYQLMILMLIHFWLQNPKHLPRRTSTLTSCPPEGGGFLGSSTGKNSAFCKNLGVNPRFFEVQHLYTGPGIFYHELANHGSQMIGHS